MTDRIEIKAHLTATEEGVIEGTAWPFGSADRVGDVIEQGAFDRPASLPMLFAHDQSQVVGVWETIEETPAGLSVKGRLLVDDVERAREVRAMIRNGAVRGLSIGFQTRKANRTAKGRSITALELHEISVVAVPCHPGAQITALKGNPATIEQHGVSAPMENEDLNPAQTAPVANAPTIDTKALDAIKTRLDAIEAKAQRPGVHATGPVESIERKAFVEFLQTGRMDAKALTNAADAAAGYVLAPKELEAEFVRNLVEFSPVRLIADVRTTASHTIIVPKRNSVTNAVWVGETAARTASEPTFGQQEISVKELATYVDVSLQALEDSDNVLTEVSVALAEDFGAKENLAFLNGTLAVEPSGFMAAAGVGTTNNGHATNLSADALIRLFYAQPQTFRSNGTWVMNGATLGIIRALKDTTGQYLWQPSIQAGQPETILGRPVLEMKDMPSIAAAATPIAFGDFKRAFRIYDRVDLQVLPDLLTQRTNGMARFHARRRVGSAVVRPDAFRKLVMAV